MKNHLKSAVCSLLLESARAYPPSVPFQVEAPSIPAFTGVASAGCLAYVPRLRARVDKRRLPFR